MPSRRFDWHERVRAVEAEYIAVGRAGGGAGAARPARQLAVTTASTEGRTLRLAEKNFEGTYLVRLFAAFEAALRSFVVSRRGAAVRILPASVLIDVIGGKGMLRLSASRRDEAHEVRRARNYWAHDDDAAPRSALVKLDLAASRHRLQHFLACLPEQWN